MLKILLVEDAEEFAVSLAERLELDDYQVRISGNGSEALDILKNEDFDLLVVDWDLPGLSGVELINAYRRAGGNRPIIMLTGRADVESRAEGLDSGADDYLPKPFAAAELLVRLRSILRRPKKILPDRIRMQTLEIDFVKKTVSVEGKKVSLARMEFAVLEFLIAHPKQMFSAKALIDAVWASEVESGEDAVRTCVRRLRKKITDSQGNCVVDTELRSGYVVRHEFVAI